MTFRTEQIGDCTLVLGDALDVLPGLPEVDAVVTDAPFGIRDRPLQIGYRVGDRRGGDNDYHPETDWDDAIDPAWCAACCDAAPVVAWFGQWRKREEVTAAMRWPIRCEIIWAKDTHVGPPCPVAMRDERIWIFAERGIKGARFETSVWEHPIIPTWAYKHHKNEKPVGLMARLIQWLGPETVCDPFMGSGSTGCAAVKLGRRFIGIEKEPEHFETACRRIEAVYRQPRLDLPEPEKPKQEAMAL